jgi:hypothetical protein
MAGKREGPLAKDMFPSAKRPSGGVTRKGESKAQSLHLHWHTIKNFPLFLRAKVECLFQNGLYGKGESVLFFLLVVRINSKDSCLWVVDR